MSRIALGVLFGLLANAAIAQTQNPSFNLVNRGSVAIRELFFTPAGDANWGRNRLQSAIAPGASYPARRRIDGNCVFDIRVVFADGRVEDRRGLNTCTVDDVAFGATAAPAGSRKAADDPSFRLINRGQVPITELHVVPSGTAGWGDNRIGSGLLPQQTDRAIGVERRPGDCRYDLRVVFAGGRALERRRADLCKLSELPVP